MRERIGPEEALLLPEKYMHFQFTNVIMVKLDFDMQIYLGKAMI